MSDDIKKLEDKAQALTTQAQELNQKLQQINIEFIKVQGAIDGGRHIPTMEILINAPTFILNMKTHH